MNTTFIRDWLRALKRHPVRVIGIALVLLLLWLLRVFAEGETYEAERKWLAARSDTAMWILHLIAAHWWWIGWFLIPLTITVVLVWAAIDAARENRKKLVPIEYLTEQALREAVIKWLSHRFSDFKIEKAFLFGSIMHDDYATSDVDVVVVYRSMSDKQLTKIGRTLKTKVANDFKVTFGHPLHLTLIAAQEAQILEGFLHKAGEHRAVNINGASNASH